MQGLVNNIKSVGLGVAEYLTPVLLVSACKASTFFVSQFEARLILIRDKKWF